jgi:ubiquinone/menaquinone biosynthesis C-methylase UbiE
MDSKAHWEKVYQEKAPDQVSWYQAEAALSQRLIEELAPDRSAAILDVGAGASVLVDGLLRAEYRDLSVLDISSAALRQSQQRLGASADAVRWIAGDVLTTPLAAASVDVWHDRAVFHFLTDADDRARYVRQVRRAVRPRGIVLVATFADDGPTKCSGLDVMRYTPDALHDEFGGAFRLLRSEREEHRTPWGAVQSFTYCLCRFEP